MFFYFLKRLISSIFFWTGDNFQFNLYHQSDIQSLMILVNCYKVLAALHFLVSLLPRRKDVWNLQLRENFYFCPYKYWNHFFFHRFQWWRIPSWQFNIVFLMYTIAVKKNCSLRQLKLTCNWFFRQNEFKSFHCNWTITLITDIFLFLSFTVYLIRINFSFFC